MWLSEHNVIYKFCKAWSNFWGFYDGIRSHEMKYLS